MKLHALVEKDTSRKLLTKLNPEIKIGTSKNDDIAVIAHKVCCVVAVWRDQSERIRKDATDQAANFCAVGDEIGRAFGDAAGFMVSYLAGPRVQEVEERINEYKNATHCTFTPSRLDEED